MLKTLMENSIDNHNLNINDSNNFSFLKGNNNIPKLYQKKKVAFLSKSIKKENISTIKEYEKYINIFQSKNIKPSNYANIYNKCNTINSRYFKNNNTINKSNINTINSTTNNTNNNTFLNNTNNNNNSIFNIYSNNLYNTTTFKNKFIQNKNHSQKSIEENKINKESDNDSDINDIIKDETEEEKIPVHISNYNGGLKADRDWGLSKTDAKRDKLVTNGKVKNNANTYNHRNNNNKFKFNTFNNDDIKKKLLYSGNNKDAIDNKDNKDNQINNNININNNENNNRILTSPNINLNKIKKLNFDQPFKCLKIGNINKNGENTKINKVPKIMIDLTNLKYKKENYINCSTSLTNETSDRNDKKFRNKLMVVNSSENINRNRYSQTEENNISDNIRKRDLLSPNINKYDLNQKYFHNNSLYSKYTNIKNNYQTDRENKPNKLIYSYTIKRYNNLNLSKCTKIIRHMKINKDNICNNNKIYLNDFIFDIGNIKFKHYIENYLDEKSLIILSSTNKNFYNNFRHVIYYKYYMELLYENNNKENIDKTIKSLLKYSCSKLKNKKKEEIEQIYNSFNYKSIYNDNIIKDLTRTFPNDITFNKNSLGYYKLFNILTIYSNFNKQIGYTQGLNFMSAIGVSLFDTEEEVFVFLDGLINRFELDKYMGINNKNLVKNLKYFSNILNKYVPEIISFFEKKMINHEFFSTNWILTLFSNCMNKDCLVIIWSFMIIFGWKFFYCFTIELLKFYKDDILKMKENELNYKMKHLFNNDKYEKNLNLIIKNTLQLMKNCISL